MKELFSTGDCNTGYDNTGDRNTGNRNTGYGNTGDFQAGFFCQKTNVFCFDKDTGLSLEKFIENFPEHAYLLSSLFEGEVEWEKVKNLPGITKEKLAALLKRHREARK